MSRPAPARDLLTLGGRLPWGVGLLLVLTVVPSVAAALGSRHVAPVFELAALDPSAVWRGQVWRLATYALVEPGPIGLVFTCLAYAWFGKDLAAEWGLSSFDRRPLFESSVSVELPFGGDHRWLNQGGPWAAAFGNWSLAASFTGQSGTPYTAPVVAAERAGACRPAHWSGNRQRSGSTAAADIRRKR